MLTATSAGTYTVSAAWNSVNATQSLFVSSPLYTPGLNGFNWESVNTQGMGYVTGLVIHPLPPYDIYARTDVGGAYRFDRATQRWIPLLDHYGPLESETYGVESVAVDTADANTVYLAVPHGRIVSGSSITTPAEVMVSHDKGVTWNATGLANANLYAGPNDAYRGMTGERLAVDPNDGRVLFFASRKDGLWRGVMAGTQSVTWTQVSGGLPAPSAQPGVTFVPIRCRWREDERRHNEDLVCRRHGERRLRQHRRRRDVVEDSEHAQSGPRQCSRRRHAAGVVWRRRRRVERRCGALQGRRVERHHAERCDKGLQRSYVRPCQPEHHYGRAQRQPANLSIDRPGCNVVARLSISTKWAYQPAYYLPNSASWGNAALVIDPANSKRVWQTNGYGVIETEDITAATTTWTWQMANLEELVAMKVKVPPVTTIPGTTTPGADLMAVVADMVGFRYASRAWCR